MIRLLLAQSGEPLTGLGTLMTLLLQLVVLLVTINTVLSSGLWIMVSGLSLAILIDAWKLLAHEPRRAVPIRARA